MMLVSPLIIDERWVVASKPSFCVLVVENNRRWPVRRTMGGADGVTKGPNPPRSQFVTPATPFGAITDVERTVSNFQPYIPGTALVLFLSLQAMSPSVK